MSGRSALLAAALLLGGCGQSGNGGTAKTSLPADFKLATKTIELPADRATLPAGAEIVTTNCTGCHSAEMLTTQPPLDAKTWGAEIAKMRKVYHAPIDPADDERLVTALLKLQAPAASPRP